MDILSYRLLPETSDQKPLEQVIGSDFNRLNIQPPSTNLELEKLSVYLGIRGSSHELTEQGRIPPYILHQWQVLTVSDALLDGLNASHEDHENAQKHGLFHDWGRAYTMDGRHPEIGKIMIQYLNYPPEFSDFAGEHHIWGLNGSIGNKHKEGLLNGNKEQIFPVMYDEFMQKYGLAGLVVLIADNSKIPSESKDPYSRHIPSIGPFSRELGIKLILNQIDKGSYEVGSERHRLELVGMEFLLYIIDRLGSEFGLDYLKTIEEAQKRWPDQLAQLQSLWQEVRSYEFPQGRESQPAETIPASSTLPPQ